MPDPARRLRSDDYKRYVDIAADARSAEELAQLRAELRANWPEDTTAQLLAEVLYDQEQSFDALDGARAQGSAVWHDDPTLLQPRRARRLSTEIPEVSSEAPSPPDDVAPNG